MITKDNPWEWGGESEKPYWAGEAGRMSNVEGCLSCSQPEATASCSAVSLGH